MTKKAQENEWSGKNIFRLSVEVDLTLSSRHRRTTNYRSMVNCVARCNVVIARFKILV